MPQQGTKRTAAILGRGEAGLAIAIMVVVGLTIALDPLRSYVVDPSTNAVEIVRQTAMLGIFALGTTVVIISGGIDLSVGSMIAFSGTICASLLLWLAPDELQNDEPVGIAVIAAAIAGTLLAGFLVGSLHAWLITVIGLPPFIATLATLVGLRSLSRALVEGVTTAVIGGTKAQIEIRDEQFRYLATSVWIPVVVFLALAVFTWLLMSRTVVGRHLYALGGNEAATRLSGIRADGLKWLAYALGSMFASIAGILYVGELSVAAPQTLGRGYELNAIAAAVVGGCSLQGGAGTVPGTILGCLFLRVVIDGIAKIIKTGADVYEGLIVGVVVVLAVAVGQVRQSRGRRAKFFSGALGTVTIANLALLAAALGALLAGRNTATVVGVAVLLTCSAIALVERKRGN
ncbi:MAG TPA: ABC transporter permease [Pirellulales bacterium]|jgi:ribose/xylose/arabinose/galactoside ABC-type transport system permease subunit|nr:ABC transporter permease [Pirellulales bacterium]